MNAPAQTHSKLIGYVLWIFGFTGSHRFYYGKPVSGTIWFFTAGLLLIGWIIDLFLIPSMARRADCRYVAGPKDYSVAWILLTFLGVFGVHRFYLGKWGTGILYLVTLRVRARISSGYKALIYQSVERWLHRLSGARSTECL